MNQVLKVADHQNKLSKIYSNKILDNNSHKSMIKRQENGDSDIDILQKYYLELMQEMYQRNKSRYPSPNIIIRNLRNMENKLRDFGMEGMEGRQQMREKLVMSQKLMQSQTKTMQSLSIGIEEVSNNKKMEQKNKKISDEIYFKMKLKFISLLQQNIIDSYYFFKLSTVQYDKIPQIIYENVDHIIKSLKHNIKQMQQKSIQQNSKKIKQIEQKSKNKLAQLQKQIKINQQKIESLQKKLDNQKKQHCIDNYKNYQNIVDKQNILQELKQLYLSNLYQLRIQQQIVYEDKIVIDKYQNNVQDLQNRYNELNRKYKQLIKINTKLQKQIIQQSQNKLTSNLLKTNSYSSLNCIKIDHQQNLIYIFKNYIQQLENIIKYKDSQFEKNIKEIICKDKNQLTKIVYQWKEMLQKIINENDREMTLKNQLIEVLEKQVTQLRKAQYQSLLTDEKPNNYSNNSLTQQQYISTQSQ